MKKKILITLLSLVSAIFCAVGLAACGENEKPTEHAHDYSSDWAHDETYHWHECLNDGCDARIKDKAEHSFTDGKCVCDYELPDKTTALNNFFERYIADEVFGNKTVFSKTVYANEENDTLTDITVVYTYEITEIDRAIEIAEVSFAPVSTSAIINSSATAPQIEINRTTVFEFDAKENYDRQNVAEAIFKAINCTSNLKLFIEQETNQVGYGKFATFSCEDNTYKVKTLEVVNGDGSDEALILNLGYSSQIDYIRTTSTNTINGTIIYDNAYTLEELPNVKARYKAVKENGNIVGYNLTEICDKNATTFELPAEYYGKPVVSVDKSVFDECPALESITADENNSEYASADGILYNKSRTEIIYVPKAIAGKVTICDGVTAIASNHLANRSYLTEIVIPDSVNSIRDYAFDGCNALESITLPFVNRRIGYFFNSNVPETLRTVTITGGDNINDDAFNGCENIERIVLPSGLKNIGTNAFYNCSSLVSITIPASVTTIGSGAFSSCDMTIVLCEAASAPSGWNNNFADGALAVIYDCKNNDADADGNIYTVQGALAFSIKDGAACVVGGRTDSSGSVVIPDSITYKDISYPVTELKKLFGANLTAITLGSELVNLPLTGLSTLGTLASIEVSESNTAYSSYDGILYNKAKTEFIVIPLALSGDVEIPSTVSAISNSAFKGRVRLASLTIPDSVTEIGYSAFENCTSLKSVRLPNGLKEIKQSTFSGCTYLQSIEIPSSVKTIYFYAFQSCRSLQMVVIPETVTSIGVGILYGCTALKNLTISFSAFKAADGSDASAQYPLGYLFSTYHSYDTLEYAAYQYYYGYNSTGRLEYVSSTYYIPVSLTSVTVTGTGIYCGAFQNCTHITEITISKSVTYVDDDAFYNCDAKIIRLS